MDDFGRVHRLNIYQYSLYISFEKYSFLFTTVKTIIHFLMNIGSRSISTAYIYCILYLKKETLHNLYKKNIASYNVYRTVQFCKRP